MTLIETNTDSVTATVSVDATNVNITITQGANTGSNDFAIATYTTVTDMVNAINAAAIGVTATAITATT